MKTDADFATEDLTEKADIESWLRKQGVCAHGNINVEFHLFLF